MASARRRTNSAARRADRPDVVQQQWLLVYLLKRRGLLLDSWLLWIELNASLRSGWTLRTTRDFGGLDGGADGLIFLIRRKVANGIGL